MSWSKENLEKFIEMYRSYPCLWKVQADEYKNKNFKNAAYQALVIFCKESVCRDANKDFVIKKIQGIRGAFRKEVKKIKESKRSGSSEDDVHKPNLWYFDLLLFTLDQDEPTKSFSNINEENSQDLEEVDNNRIDIEVDNGQEEAGIEKETETEKEKIVVSVPTSTPKVSSYLSQTRTAKRLNSTTANLQFMQECQRALKRSTTETTEYEAVGINVTRKLEKMDNTQAIYAETIINSVLGKGLLKQLTANMDICDSANLNAASSTNSRCSSTPAISSTPMPDISETFSQSNAEESVTDDLRREASQATNIVEYYEESASFFDL